MRTTLPRWMTAIVACAVFVGTAAACFWDSDTLRTEADAMPGVVEAIVGFVPRYPGLYYERRIEIAQAKLETDADDLGAYDDVAVAFDRLHDSDRAIEWIAKKREALDRLLAAGEDTGDHEYRYHANLGTFYAHKWIRTAKPERAADDIQRAQHEIEKAIEINPEAHFGRERVQLELIEWVQHPDRTQLNGDEHFRLNRWDLADRGYGPLRYAENSAHAAQDVVEGLVGLVVLGEAWQSIDVYLRLKAAFLAREDSSLAYLASLRARQAFMDGASSFDMTVQRELQENGIDPEDGSGALFEPEPIRVFFTESTERALQYREQHAAWISQKIKGGEHPDTHPKFWSGEPKLPKLELPNGFLGLLGYNFEVARALFVIVLVVAGAAFLRVLKRRRLRTQTAT